MNARRVKVWTALAMVGLLLLLAGNVAYVPPGEKGAADQAGPEGLSGLYGLVTGDAPGGPGTTSTGTRSAETDMTPVGGEPGNPLPPFGTRGGIADEPSIGGGAFASYTPGSLSPGLGDASTGAGVALGDLDHDGVQDMVVSSLNGATKEFEFWVCRSLNASSTCDGGVSPKRTRGGPTDGFLGAGIALGDIDGNRELDVLFMRISSGYQFSFWVCADMDVQGQCRNGWTSSGVSFSFPITVLEQVRGGGVALADVGGTPALDAVFTLVSRDYRLSDGAEWADHWALVCLDLAIPAQCGNVSGLTDLRLPDLDSAAKGAGVALAEVTGDNDLDLIVASYAHRTGFVYRICPGFVAGRQGYYAVFQCYNGYASSVKRLPEVFVGSAVGGSFALATDIYRHRDLNGNGSLDAVFLLVNGTTSPDRFDYWVALDGFVSVEVLDTGMKNLPWVPYLIVHDPSGSASQACFERYTKNTLSTELRTQWGVGLALSASVGPVSGALGVSVSITGTESVETSYTTSDRLCSSGDPERDHIGPGYGDRYWGGQWDLTWYLLRKTVDREGVLSSGPSWAYTVDSRSEWTRYAWEIQQWPGSDPWRDFLLGFDIGADNEVLPDAIVRRIWENTTASTEVQMSVEDTRKVSSEFSFEVDASVAVQLGLASAEVTVSYSTGTTVTASTTEVATNTYHILDTVPSGTNRDRLDIDVYWDEAFGTLYFRTRNAGTDPQGMSRTTLPCEHWTACGDTTPPRLHSAEIEGNLAIYDPATVPSAPMFTLRGFLNDGPEGTGIASVQANLTRVSSWRAAYGVLTSRVLPLSAGPSLLLDGELWTRFEDTASVQSTHGRLEGMYIVTIYTVDVEGNGAEFENRGALAVTRDGSAVAVKTLVSPGNTPPLQVGANNLIAFDASPPSIDLSLAIESRSVVTNYSVSVVQFTSYPNASADQATAGIFVEIEASQNLDNAIQSVVICVGYDPNDLPPNPDGSRVREETLHLKWFDHVTRLWVELPYPRDAAGNEIPVDTVNHVVCGFSTHFSLYGPIGNFRPFADLGSVPPSVTEGTMLAFDASRSYDRDGTIVAYAWDFGDGSPVVTGVAQSHVFGDDGTYPVSLTVTDNGGERGTATAAIAVSNVPPQGAFTAIPGGVEGVALAFSFRGTDPGSDDLTFQWDYADGEAEVGTWYNDGSGPDGPVSPLGTFPFAATDNRAHAYGDDGAFWPTVAVCDDDGGCATVSAEVRVANVAPALSIEVVPSGPEGAILQFRASATDPGSDDLAFTWSGECVGWSSRTSWNDPAVGPDPIPSPTWNPREAADAQDVVCGDDGSFSWNLEVEDDDGGWTTVSGTFDVDNLPPSLAVSPPSAVSIDEATAVTLSATAVDPGSDDLTFAWAWAHGPMEVRTYHNDGVAPDPLHSPAGAYPFTAQDASTHVYGDDCECQVVLTVSDDDGGMVAYETTVTVVNVNPIIQDVRVYAIADVALRVAGEKWHDVRLDVEAYEVTMDTVSVTRYPGSPDEQSATILGARLQLLGTPRLVVAYTPEDDPPNGQPNGGTPTWVRIGFADGYAVEFHHTFTANRAGTWVVSLDDLRAHLVGRPLVFEVDAADAGSDDLTAIWDFGDGGGDVQIAYNDGTAPDPYPSLEVRPLAVTFQATHAYAAGGFTATVTVTDDDGGRVARPVLVPL